MSNTNFFIFVVRWNCNWQFLGSIESQWNVNFHSSSIEKEQKHIPISFDSCVVPPNAEFPFSMNNFLYSASAVTCHILSYNNRQQSNSNRQTYSHIWSQYTLIIMRISKSIEQILIEQQELQSTPHELSSKTTHTQHCTAQTQSNKQSSWTLNCPAEAAYQLPIANGWSSKNHQFVINSIPIYGNMSIRRISIKIVDIIPSVIVSNSNN